jgi:transposase
MMGYKARAFGSLGDVTLDDLVPADNFYRHVERTLDLSFVRDLVRGCYAAGGRPSIDPVVFFKLQLVLFFEGIRSERQLERVGSDRLSVRWYLGYDLHEPLPDHSSLTRIRERYGIDIFRQFFEKVVDWCQQEGLVWGRQLYADATLVEADADRDKMLPRFAVERHIVGLFRTAREPDEPPDADETTEGARSAPEPSLGGHSPPAELEVVLSAEQAARLAEQNETRYDWYAANGEPDRSIQRGSYQRMSDLWVSLTDRDAVLMRQHNGGVHLRYRDHYLVDGGKARIILGVLVTAADVRENMPFLDMIWRACFRWRLRPYSATGDATYGTLEIIRALEDNGVRAYLPVTDHEKKSPLFGRSKFRYDAENNQYICPNGSVLRFERNKYDTQTYVYRADASTCNVCPLKAQCTSGEDGRSLQRSFFQEYLDRVEAYHQTDEYKKAYRKRKVWVEPLFGEGQQWHGLRRFRLRGLAKVNCEAVVTATGQNLKRLLSARGWGRRHFPGGAPGIQLPLSPSVLCA